MDSLLRTISTIRRRIPFGINSVVSPGRALELQGVIDLAIGIGADSVLIIPEHYNGSFLVSGDDWSEIDECIDDNQARIQINVTDAASSYLQSKCLETEGQNEFAFAHVSAERRLRTRSYGNGGIPIEDLDIIEQYLCQVRNREFN